MKVTTKSIYGILVIKKDEWIHSKLSITIVFSDVHKRQPKQKHGYQAELAWQAYVDLSPKFKKNTTPVAYLEINNSPINFSMGLINIAHSFC